MTMTQDKVIDSMIAFYRQEGIDMSALFSNPVFNNLPLDAKVAAIKKYAAEIRDGTNPNYSKYEKGVIGVGALTGTISGMAAGSVGAAAALKAIEAVAGTALGLKMNHNKILAKVLLSGAIVGAGLGAMAGSMSEYRSKTYRGLVKDYAGKLAKDPTDVNAIGLLSANVDFTTARHPFASVAAKTLASELLPKLRSQEMHDSMANIYRMTHLEDNAEFYKNLSPDTQAKFGIVNGNQV